MVHFLQVTIKKVMLGIQNEREWKAFCEIVLDQADLAQHADFINNTQRSKTAMPYAKLLLILLMV